MRNVLLCRVCIYTCTPTAIQWHYASNKALALLAVITEDLFAFKSVKYQSLIIILIHCVLLNSKLILILCEFTLTIALLRYFNRRFFNQPTLESRFEFKRVNYMVLKWWELRIAKIIINLYNISLPFNLHLN